MCLDLEVISVARKNWNIGLHWIWLFWASFGRIQTSGGELVLWSEIWHHTYLQRGKGKTKPYSLVLGSYQWGKKYFSVYVQKLPKKAKFIAIRYFNFWVQHWQLPSLDTYGFVWPDWFLAWVKTWISNYLDILWN